MKIGLDFDGVICDSQTLKAKAAEMLYKIKIKPEQMKKPVVTKLGILTAEQYTKAANLAYNSEELAELMTSIPDALNFIKRLLDEKHQIKVITFRGQNEARIAKEWLQKNNIDINIISVGYLENTTKTEACKGLDVFVDDDLNKLEPLVNVVPNRFLFTHEYNKEDNVQNIAVRVDSWKQIYEKIKKCEYTKP